MRAKSYRGMSCPTEQYVITPFPNRQYNCKDYSLEFKLSQRSSIILQRKIYEQEAKPKQLQKRRISGDSRK